MDDTFATHDVINQSPVLEDINLFSTDRPLMEAVLREGAGHAAKRLAAFGQICGSAEALQQGRLANENPPRLKTFDAKGRRLDIVEFHPAYHACMEISVKQGLHCSAWDHLASPDSKPAPGANVARSAASYMATQMEAGHQCPTTMTNAAVPTLLLEPDIAKWWIPKILSREYDKSFKPADQKTGVTIGMGMTEKQGGTDVRANTTSAAPAGNGGPGAEYLITGHKWFMSAPMCDAFLVLAQAPGGLSCFLMPRFLPDGTVNSLHLQRLKDKLGNRSNASSEVEFKDAHAWLIGEEGRGVPNIIEMVTGTRLDCAVASAGLMRWALANAIHHCRHRAVFGKALIDQPLMTQVLADLALDVEAATALCFRLARSFDRAADENAAAWRRLMTPVTKYWVCKIAPGVRLRGHGVPGRQRLRRGRADGPPVSRDAPQCHLGGLGQRDGAGPAARPAARARDGRDRDGRPQRRGRQRCAPEGASGACAKAAARAEVARQAGEGPGRSAGVAGGRHDPARARAGPCRRRLHRHALGRRRTPDLRARTGLGGYPLDRRAGLPQMK